MKKSYILAAVAIIAAIAIILSGVKDVASYATFADASESLSEVKITGELDLDKDIDYDPENEPNLFSFYLVDNDGVSKKVIMKQPKPQDFEKSESIVVTGKMKQDQFVADEILMKCPSKYKDDEIRIRAEI